MKKFSKTGFITLIIFVLMVGCAPNSKDEVVKDDKGNTKKEEPSIVPNYQLSDDDYKTILPFKPSEARGIITDQLANRLDVDEIEEGLKRHSKQVYDPKDYYFEEGQYLTKDMVYEWLDRKEKGNKGLNPEIKTSEKDGKKKVKIAEEENPRYLSHILEQDYLRKKKDDSVELAGVSIGLAMKSVYRYQTETGGPYYYKKISKKEMQAQGEQIAQKIVNRMRDVKELKNVPIFVMLYREEEQSSPVPGHFVSKAYVDKGEQKLGKWENLNEEYILFPSDRAKKNNFEDYETVKTFGEDVSHYFPNYVGIIGEGFYINKELQQLKIEIPIEFYGKSEVVGFTQYAYGLIKDKFPNHYDIEVQVTSNQKLESLITRKKGEKDPTVHILD